MQVKLTELVTYCVYLCIIMITLILNDIITISNFGDCCPLHSFQLYYREPANLKINCTRAKYHDGTDVN